MYPWLTWNSLHRLAPTHRNPPVSWMLGSKVYTTTSGLQTLFLRYKETEIQNYEMACPRSEHKSRADLGLEFGCLILLLWIFFSKYQASILGAAFLPLNFCILSLTFALEIPGGMGPTINRAQCQSQNSHHLKSPWYAAALNTHSSTSFSFLIWNIHISITPSIFLSMWT